jgi:hypothetical protein
MRRLSCGAQGFTDGRKSKEVFMKIKTKQLFSLAAGFIVIGFAVLALISGCDMDFIPMPFSPDEVLLNPPDEIGSGGGPEIDNGGGNVPEASYLTIKSFPINADTSNISNVFLYNSSGAVAKCAGYDEIVLTNESSSSTVKIPLFNNSNNERFSSSGSFTVSFSYRHDSSSQIFKNREDGFTVVCTNGSGSVDLADDYGFFSGGLANPEDLIAPVVKRNTVFEMNGFYYSFSADASAGSASFTETCLVYVYASLDSGNIGFEYSTAAPVYDNYKKAYYDGSKRALFKYVFIRDSTNRYFAKKPVSENFTNLAYYTAASSTAAFQGLPVHYSLAGGSNPSAQSVSLPAGGYVFVLSGAGGGGSTGSGGAGGFVSEVITVSKTSSFTVYTGAGGVNGSQVSYDTVLDLAGRGGGGGGAGSFAYSADGWFLCAGGGGGSGANVNTVKMGGMGGSGPGSISHAVYGGPGGAGGSAGPGGAGINGETIGTSSYKGGAGGAGGGSGSSNILGITGANSGFGGSGYVVAGGAAAYFVFPPPLDWLNTNNANGQGGGGAHPHVFGAPYPNYDNQISPSYSAGGNGGNNRNSTRGGGGAARAAGSVTIYKIF